MHGVCAQLKEQDLKANKYKSVREIIYLSIYPSINLNVSVSLNLYLSVSIIPKPNICHFVLSSTPFCERMEQQQQYKWQLVLCASFLWSDGCL